MNLQTVSLPGATLYAMYRTFVFDWHVCFHVVKYISSLWFCTLWKTDPLTWNGWKTIVLYLIYQITIQENLSLLSSFKFHWMPRWAGLFICNFDFLASKFWHEELSFYALFCWFRCRVEPVVVEPNSSTASTKWVGLVLCGIFLRQVILGLKWSPSRLIKFSNLCLQML